MYQLSGGKTHLIMVDKAKFKITNAFDSIPKKDGPTLNVLFSINNKDFTL